MRPRIVSRTSGTSVRNGEARSACCDWRRCSISCTEPSSGKGLWPIKAKNKVAPRPKISARISSKVAFIAGRAYAGVNGRHNVGMVQQRHGADLAQETGDKPRLLRRVHGHNLDGHLAAHLHVLRLEYDSQPTGANSAENPVIAEHQ